VDKINTDQLAICPSCGAAMHFSRIVPSIDGLPEMQTFECRPCQLAITAEQVLEFSETAGHRGRGLFAQTPCTRFEIEHFSGRLEAD
jgi:hypothetical protein